MYSLSARRISFQTDSILKELVGQNANIRINTLTIIVLVICLCLKVYFMHKEKVF